MEYTLDIKRIDFPGLQMTRGDNIDFITSYYKRFFITPQQSCNVVVEKLRKQLELRELYHVNNNDDFFLADLNCVTHSHFSFEVFKLFVLVNCEQTEDFYRTYYKAGMDKNKDYIFISCDTVRQEVRSNHPLIDMYCKYLKGLDDRNIDEVNDYVENLYYMNNCKLNYLIEKEVAIRIKEIKRRD